MKINILILLTSSLLWPLTTVGQAPPPSLDQLRAKEMLNARLREEEEKRKQEMEKKLEKAGEISSGVARKNSPRVYNSEKDLPAAERKLLATDPVALAKYGEFLQQPNTGFFRLLNLNETKLAVTDVKSQSGYPPIPGGGTYYSFSKQNHIASEWAQIRLQAGILQPAYTEMKRTTITHSGGVQQRFVYTSGYALALFTELPLNQLDEVTMLSPAISFLATYHPPTQYQDFTTQVKRNEAGFAIAAQSYKSALPARPGAVYALRSVSYKKADVLLVFQIVQTDSEGSLQILWKQLNRFPTPELKGKP